MASMDAPVVSFKQWNCFTKIALKLYPDYAEYGVSGLRGTTNTGFNVKYALLPKEFDYRTSHPKDMFVMTPLVGVAGATLYYLAIHRNIDVYSTLGFAFILALISCGIGYGLRRLLKRDYTFLATPVGNLLIVKDGKHDLIVKELQTRRVAALTEAAVVNPLEPPWMQIKKFKWLKDEGIISDDSFRAYREQILSSADTKTDNAIQNVVLH
jgi:hypothetical protein